MKGTWFVLLCLCLELCLGGQFVTYNYGGRNNMLYIPNASGSKPLPLFVMLHGCTQVNKCKNIISTLHITHTNIPNSHIPYYSIILYVLQHFLHPS